MGFIPSLLNLASRPRIQNGARLPPRESEFIHGGWGKFRCFCGPPQLGPTDEILFLSIYFCCCCCCSVTKSCSTPCNPMDCSMPGSSVLHYLPEFAQTYVHWVSDAIQPSYPLSFHSPLALQFFSLEGDNEKRLRSTAPDKDSPCMSKLVCPSWALHGEGLW